ncbi:MAG TPA: hypothetical protein VHO25_12595, partial [Polyangiaceae bacterium]|nr:hypothetical protein [Polyangiaceae bacterium]
LRMYGYYYAFEATGVREVDMILSSVAIAGKRYHLTEDWNEETPGPAPVDVIQAAANLAASSVSRMRAAVGDDASGRTFSELLTEAAARLACLGDGPMVDCLRLKAEQLREIE